MQKKAAVILFFILFSANFLFAEEPAERVQTDVVKTSLDKQYFAVQPGRESLLAVRFQLQKDWHFYASAKTAPGRMNLKIIPSAKKYITFSEPIFPKSESYFDKSTNTRLDVFSGDFTVLIPFTAELPDISSNTTTNATIEVAIGGAICSQLQCRTPDFGRLATDIQISPDAAMQKPRFTLPDSAGTVPQHPDTTASSGFAGYSIWFAFLTAFLAGLSLNIMPCVWPVLPLIVMRIVRQSNQSKTRAAAMGLAFCIGILLFFAVLAAANIVLQAFYGVVLQWGDQFRSPAFVAAMAILLVVLALFMFGLFSISVPSSTAGKSGSGKGYTGAVGMGFLAAVLSTPCSFAILAAAFAWAQAQPLGRATFAIMLIGAGMALPYAVLTLLPGLLQKLPRAGRWMELFKQTVGFILLVIAVKLIAALPQTRRMDILYFAVILSFALWMWGSWVSYNTKLSGKLLIRLIATALVFASGWMFLARPAGELIVWEKYDRALIDEQIQLGRAVLIKFTADWCLSCQVVEKQVYSRADIAKLITEKNVFAVKADTTVHDYPATSALKDVYKEPGVPVTILHLPGSEIPLRWRGMFFGDTLKNSLQQISSGQ
jgi:thiol:disulfide interchange protein